MGRRESVKLIPVEAYSSDGTLLFTAPGDGTVEYHVPKEKVDSYFRALGDRVSRERGEYYGAFHPELFTFPEVTKR